MCDFPLFGAMNFSTSSENMMSPTLSLLRMAENASTAQISVAISIFVDSAVPNCPDRLTSTTSITVSSRSSSKILMNGLFARAVTFQSIFRMSSPYEYSRTSENSIPRPLKTEWYSPEKT
jgi:hypothetical protein